jgi:hypothetical protein
LTLAELDRQLARLNSHSLESSTSEDQPGGPRASQTIHPAAFQRDPPRYLVAELGGWPRTAAAQAVWRLAATHIDAHRRSTSIFDPKTALGPAPDDPEQRAQHDSLAQFVHEAAKSIDALENVRLPEPSDSAAFLELP